MLLLIAVLILAYFAQQYVLEHGLDLVTFSQKTSSNIVDPDEIFEVQTTFENGKKTIPILLQVKEHLPEELSILGEHNKSRVSYNRTRYHEYSQYLGRKSKVTRTYNATLPKRGRYYFRGATINGNDFFGVKESTMQAFSEVEVVVAPKRISLTKIENVLGGFLGNISVRRYIMEDPILITGFREYTGREPFRAIAWNQSAKTRSLMVKQYDYTTDPTATVILSVEDGKHEDIEICFSIARTVCEVLEEKRISYDFLTNASAAGALGIWKSVGEGLGSKHVSTIIEGLGRATYDSTESLQTTLKHLYKKIGNSSYILVVPEQTRAVKEEVKRLSDIKGGSILVITPKEVLQ